jgi:hypothetical protein
VPAGNDDEALLRVADQLCAELGRLGTGEAPGGRSTLAEEGVMAGALDAEDEALVTALRRGLARIAAAVGGEDGEESPPRAVSTALDGAELVIRGEILVGNRGRLSRLMPSFVFLVSLPLVEQDRALGLSRRTEELLASP